jgi:hypothetical protein
MRTQGKLAVTSSDVNTQKQEAIRVKFRIAWNDLFYGAERGT